MQWGSKGKSGRFSNRSSGVRKVFIRNSSSLLKILFFS
jgi:hypothetical protein